MRRPNKQHVCSIDGRENNKSTNALLNELELLEAWNRAATTNDVWKAEIDTAPLISHIVPDFLTSAALLRSDG
jgi:hypothetical protein